MKAKIMTDRREFLGRAAQLVAGVSVAGLDIRANAQERGYKIVTVTNGGSVMGEVRLVGKAPEPDRTIIGKDNHICGDGYAAPDAVLVGPNGGVANAVVSIRGLASGLGWPAGQAHGIIQERCAFQPYVQVAPPNAELTIRNKDPLLHNIHAYELIGRARRTLFNIAQPQAGQVDRHKLELRRGNVVELDCDAHNWMSAWVFISEHPYAAVVDPTGRFEFKNVVPGSYELTAWHPVLGTTAVPISIGAGAKATAQLAFRGEG